MGQRGNQMSVALLLILAAPAVGARELELGPADGIAVDQPRVTFGLVVAGTERLIGPEMYNTGALDTGANGVLLARLAYANEEKYGQAMRGETPVYFDERGLTSSQALAVLPEYDLVVRPEDQGPEFTLPRVRALSSEAMDLGSFGGVVGMPAMIGRVVVLNLEPMGQLEFIGVRFAESPPAGGSGWYEVSLSQLPAKHEGQRHPQDPLPTYASLPMVSVELATAKGRWSGKMLLDTGAQNTYISPAVAHALGINTESFVAEGGDVLMTLPTTGVGGVGTITFVRGGRLLLPTREGSSLVWTEVVVGVHELPAGIDGVFGMNLLTSGYSSQLVGALGGQSSEAATTQELESLMKDLGLDSSAADLANLGGSLGGLLGGAAQPFFKTVVFDFRQAAGWRMVLELHPRSQISRQSPSRTVPQSAGRR